MKKWKRWEKKSKLQERWVALKTETLESEAALVESGCLGVYNVVWNPWMKDLSRKSNTVVFNIILIAFAIGISFSPWNLISMETVLVTLCHYPATGCTFIVDGVLEVQRLQLLEQGLISCTLGQVLTLGLWETVHWQPGIGRGQQVNDLFLLLQEEK